MPFLAGLAAAAPVWVLVGLAVPAGAQASVYNVLQMATTQRLVPAELLSRVTAVAMLGGLAIAPLAMAATGAAADAVGAGRLLLVLATVLVLATGVVLAVPDVRRLTVGGQSG